MYLERYMVPVTYKHSNTALYHQNGEEKLEREGSGMEGLGRRKEESDGGRKCVKVTNIQNKCMSPAAPGSSTKPF